MRGPLATGVNHNPAARALVYSDSAYPLPEGQCRGAGEAERAPGTRETLLDPTSLTNPPRFSGTGQLRPLPPKPPFPPPDMHVAAQRHNVLLSPLSPAKSIGANSPGAVSKEVKSPVGKLFCDFEGMASENIPPSSNIENAPIASTCWQDAKGSSGLPSLPQLRTEIQRISTDVVRALLPGPEAAEVRALLRRVEALMRSDSNISCGSADVAR